MFLSSFFLSVYIHKHTEIFFSVQAMTEVAPKLVAVLAPVLFGYFRTSLDNQS